jgi:ATP-binding cassette subfamily B protein
VQPAVDAALGDEVGVRAALHDPALEMRIARALERLTRGRTSVTIAHRMSTAENADEVVVVDAGRVVQRGPHATLVAEGGVYGRLHASWVAQQSVR